MPYSPQPLFSSSESQWSARYRCQGCPLLPRWSTAASRVADLRQPRDPLRGSKWTAAQAAGAVVVPGEWRAADAGQGGRQPRVVGRVQEREGEHFGGDEAAPAAKEARVPPPAEAAVEERLGQRGDPRAGERVPCPEARVGAEMWRKSVGSWRYAKGKSAPRARATTNTTSHSSASSARQESSRVPPATVTGCTRVPAR